MQVSVQESGKGLGEAESRRDWRVPDEGLELKAR